VIAAVMPNDAGVRNVNWESYKTTIDSVEALSGYDVLAALPDAIERVVESGLTPRAPTARFTFQGERLEGQRLTFDATTSTDPDVGGPLKDALSFAWTIDGEAAGIGSTMAHTFAQDGAYQVASPGRPPAEKEDPQDCSPEPMHGQDAFSRLEVAAGGRDPGRCGTANRIPPTWRAVESSSLRASIPRQTRSVKACRDGSGTKGQ